jgi:hypothetical protein
MWGMRPPHVIQFVVHRVLGGGIDHSLLVGRMKPGFFAGDEAGAK